MMQTRSFTGTGTAKAPLMRWLCAGMIVVAASAAGSEGAGLEIAVFTGPAIPTYKQTFTFTGGSPQLGFARLAVKDAPSLDTRSGLSYGAAATLFLSDSFGFEARIDSVDVDLQSFGGNYALELGPVGGPVSSTPITLGVGETDLRRVRPLSLNLRFQSQGRVGIGLSGGVSYASNIELDARPTITVSNLNATFPVSLTATPVNPDDTRHVGFNGGLTIRVKIASGVSLVAEGRGFTFKRSELKWETTESGSLTAAEQALASSITADLDIPRFTPGFWTARAGVAFRF